MMIFLTFLNYRPLIRYLSTAGVVELCGEKEMIEFARLKAPKRKDEWLGSRAAVKKMLTACVPALVGCKLSKIQILKEPSGAPYIEIDGSTRLPGWISLSHSQEHVLVAYSPDNIRFGVDLEFIEPRSPDFVKDYFTETEVHLATSGTLEQNSIFTTLIWSAKEAVLKAVSLGLQIDTRKLEIFPRPDPANKEGWNLLDVESPELKINSPRLMWRREADFIQTICVLENHDEKFEWVSI